MAARTSRRKAASMARGPGPRTAPVLRYRSPKSGSTTTTSLPAFSGLRATCSAPTRPRRRRCRRAVPLPGQPPGDGERVLVADGDDLVDQGRVQDRRDEAGADALDRCGRFAPPDSTGDAAGSTATTMPTACVLMTWATPVMVPPVPTPETKCPPGRCRPRVLGGRRAVDPGWRGCRTAAAGRRRSSGRVPPPERSRRAFLGARGENKLGAVCAQEQRRSRLMVSGITRTQRYPRTAQPSPGRCRCSRSSARR